MPSVRELAAELGVSRGKAHSLLNLDAAARYREHSQRRQFMDRTQTGANAVAVWRKIIKADPCSYCGERPSGVDHIEPTINGGLNEIDNLTGCCQSCNASKRTMPVLRFLLHERYRCEIEGLEAKRREVSDRPGGDTPNASRTDTPHFFARA